MIILQLGTPLIVICPHATHKIAQKMGVALCHEKVGCPCTTTTTTTTTNKPACSKGGGGREGGGGGRGGGGGGEEEEE